MNDKMKATKNSLTWWSIDEYRSVPHSLAKIIDLDKNEDPSEMLYHLSRYVLWAKVENDYESLDELLLFVNLKEVSTQLIVVILRFTYSVKSMLKTWKYAIEDAVRILGERNLNTQSLLRGLL